MIKLYTYSLLTFILMLPVAVIAQEEKKEKEKLKSLEELIQLERGIVKFDEVEPFIYNVPDVQDVLVYKYAGKTKINLRKGLENVSLSQTYHFNVEEKYSGIEFHIRGDVSEGTFKIKLIKPDKTVLKDIKITPGHDYDWHQPFTLDKVKKGGIGQWTVELSAAHASGFFQFYCSSR